MATRSTLRRRLLLAVAIVAALPVLYLVGANLALNTGVLRSALERDPERLRWSWRYAWSWVPGTVHARGVELEGRGARADWGLSADRLRLRFEPGELRHRRFHATELVADGVEVRYRRHTLRGDSPGGEDASESEATLSPASLPRPTRRLFETALDGVRLDRVREVRLEGVHWHGEGWAEGSVRFDNQGGVEIERLVFDLSEGSLMESNGDEAGRLESARFRGHIAHWNRRAGERRPWLRGLSGILVLDASRATLEPVSYLFRGAPVEIGGWGALTAVLRADEGHLLAGSWLEVPDASFDLRYLHYRGRGEGSLRSSVREEGGESVAGLEVVWGAYELAAGAGERVHVRGEGMGLTATSRTLDLSDLTPEVVARLTLPASEIPDLAVFDEYLPGGSLLRVHGGRGMVQGYLELETREALARGEVEVEASGVEITLQGRRLRGNLRVGSLLEDGDLQGHRFTAGGTTILLDGWRPRGGGSPWHAQIEIPAGELLVGQPLQGRAEVRARLQDSRPFVALLVEERPAARWIDGLLTVEGLDLSGELELTGRELALRRGELRGGRRLEMRSELLLGGEGWRGLMLAERGRLSAAVEVEPGRERSWKLVGARRWFEERRAVFWGNAVAGAGASRPQPSPDR